MNRYESASAFTTPDGGAAAWPLLLRIHNATVFSAGGPDFSAGGPLFLNVYTDAGARARTAGGWLIGIGAIGLGTAVLISIARYMLGPEPTYAEEAEPPYGYPVGRDPFPPVVQGWRVADPQPYAHGGAAGQHAPYPGSQSPYPGQSAQPSAWQAHGVHEMH